MCVSSKLPKQKERRSYLLNTYLRIQEESVLVGMAWHGMAAVVSLVRGS